MQHRAMAALNPLRELAPQHGDLLAQHRQLGSFDADE
jgi:hypothetical protein